MTAGSSCQALHTLFCCRPMSVIKSTICQKLEITQQRSWYRPDFAGELIADHPDWRNLSQTPSSTAEHVCGNVDSPLVPVAERLLQVQTSGISLESATSVIALHMLNIIRWSHCLVRVQSQLMALPPANPQPHHRLVKFHSTKVK